VPVAAGLRYRQPSFYALWVLRSPLLRMVHRHYAWP
jgi:hypothetical protein